MKSKILFIKHILQHNSLLREIFIHTQGVPLVVAHSALRYTVNARRKTAISALRGEFGISLHSDC